MAEPTTAIQAASPPINTPAIQFALATSVQANAANNAAFLTEIAQTVVSNDLQLLDNNQATTPLDVSTNEGLLSLNTPALSLLNEIGANPGSTNSTGNLTTQQLQEIGILLKDEQGLEAAANLGSNIPLAGGVTTVDLSVAAQAIVDGVSTAAPGNAPNPLITTQLGQIGAILAPLVNEPLTQPLFLQLQAQLTAAGVSPQQFSLNTIFLVMSYIAAMQPAPIAAVIDANKNSQVKVESKDEETVAPAVSVDRVAVEDSAILSG